MPNWIAERVKGGVLEVQEYVRLLGQVAHAAVSRPYFARDMVEQFDAIGVGSLVVVLLTGLFTGAVLALQSGFTLDQFGARSEVGRLVGATMVRELGPVLTALMVAGRVGSGIAAELGSMTVTEQISRLAGVARDEGDHLGEQFMQWFLREQVEEVAVMTRLLRVADRAGHNLFDLETFVAREIGTGATEPGAPSIAGR